MDRQELNPSSVGKQNEDRNSAAEVTVKRPFTYVHKWS
jgi:hypothetical protein